MNLTDFRVLTFDCYGTLIDWESGIWAALQPLLAQAPAPPPRDAVLSQFAELQGEQERQTPAMLYPDVLAAAHARLAATLGATLPDAAHASFGASIPDWPAFPDSPAALRYLQQHYRLVVLSNVDRASFAHSQQRLGVTFDAVYTAQDIGSYKPDLANFHYLLSHLAERGFAPGDILHTAQSLFHDHGPAKQLGLASAWIDRREGRPGGVNLRADDARYDFRFPSMAALAAAHAAEQRSPP